MREGKRYMLDQVYDRSVRLCECSDEAEVRIGQGTRTITLSPASAHRLADWIKENVPSSDEIRLRFAEREAKEAVERLARLKRKEVRGESE